MISIIIVFVPCT